MVWIYCGLFPWSKGINGVKWQDLDEALFASNFLSWALNTYEINISHRFTLAMAIKLNHMYKGRNAVSLINSTYNKSFKNNA